MLEGELWRWVRKARQSLVDSFMVLPVNKNIGDVHFVFLYAVQVPRSLKERLGLPAEQNNMETGNFFV